MSGLNVRERLFQATKYLRDRGSPAPRLDAEVLLAHVLGKDRVYLYREAGLVLDTDSEQRYHVLLERRAKGEPVAYLTGHKEFMGLDFTVGPHVLIPRPETELLVEKALATLDGWSGRRSVVDVGTGSGAIAVSLAKLAPAGTLVQATDISPQALAIARANALHHGTKVIFHCGDLLAPLQGLLAPGSVTVITANLPYIPRGAMTILPRDVRDYEPASALDGGPDGLEVYRRLIPQAKTWLSTGGRLFIEISPEQAEQALALLPPPRWQASVYRDLAGKARLICGIKEPEHLYG